MLPHGNEIYYEPASNKVLRNIEIYDFVIFREVLISYRVLSETKNISNLQSKYIVRERASISPKRSASILFYFFRYKSTEKGIYIMDPLIKRINELYAKSKNEGLTEEEKAEQAELRKKYIQGFRQGMANTLENVYIVDKDGNERKVERKK